MCKFKQFFFLLIFCESLLEAKVLSVSKLREVYKLELGDTLRYEPSDYSLHLKSFQKYQSKCANPGENCGFAYEPGEKVIPQITESRSPACERAPLPKMCEVTHRVLDSDDKTFVRLEFIGVFDVCEEIADLSNQNSCLLLAIKNGPYKPAFDAKNCERIKTLPARDACYEAIADELQDPSVCDFMKGPQGFQCVLLRAKTSRNPELCRSLEKESERASCLNAVPKASE